MRIPRPLILGTFAILLVGCGEDDHPVPTASVDDDPPARVYDLRFLEFRDSSAVISWTAPGDDGVVGTVSRYDVRLGTTPMTPPTWAGAAEIASPATPRVAGAVETLLVSLRPLGDDLWVALNAVDDAGNWSGLSNVVRLHPNELHWWNGFANAPLCCGEVDAIIRHDGVLFAGGYFRTSDGDEGAEAGLARWDGARWDGAGWDHDSQVVAFATYRDELIAGGFIPHVGGTEAHNVVRWNGSDWLPLGNGFDGPAYALAVYRDRLIAAGMFTTAGDSAAANIASWDGEVWRPLGAGLDGPVRALTVFEDRLIVGGVFSRAGGLPADALAAWDGTSWRSLGSGIERIRINALAVSGGTLFAGGEFVPRVEELGSVASWDGTGWTVLPETTELTVYAMADFHGSLVIGGSPTWSFYGSLRRWDGQGWHSFGTLVEPVTVLFVDGASLYVGGRFDRAGPWETPLIARWDE